MRKNLIAGNWKMNKDIPETADLLNALKAQLTNENPDRIVVVCPPFTSLATASSLLKGSPIKLGAQNMSEHDEGAYTGEVSWKMLVSA